MASSIGMLAASAAARFGDKTALIVEQQSWSFHEIDQSSSRIASGLHDLGVQAGDRVSIYAPNGPEWVIAYYGILKLGAVVNPLNLMLTPEEAADAMNDCGAVAVFGEAGKIAGLRTVLGDTRIRHLVAWGARVSDGAIGFDALIGGSTADWTIPEIDPLQISTVSYTSGTTGYPKGAELTHRAILFNTAMSATMHMRTPSDVVVSALPCSHVYGNIVMNAAIAYGMTLVLHTVFDAERAMASIEAHRATMFEGVPTMYYYMLASPRLKDFDLSTLTRCTVGGQTMPVPKMQQVVAALGCPLLELWGMTELGGLGTTHSAYGPARLGSIGVPLPHLQARIASVEQPEMCLAAGEIGELQMRGPMVMRGYANQAGATADAITPDGWLRTGDLARADDDGYLYIVDRLKDVIITGGFNIYPAELERVISEHPDVGMVGVCGLQDALKGEIVKAYVVPRPGALLNDEILRHYCRQRLAAYKIPKAFSFVEDLPKTSSGKVLRRELGRLDTRLS